MRRGIGWAYAVALAIICGLSRWSAAAEPPAALEQWIRQLPATDVSGKARAEAAPSGRDLLSRDVVRRLRAANRADLAAWRAIDSRAAWERRREESLANLRRSLGLSTDDRLQKGEPVATRVLGTIAGDGYRIERLVYQSRPGLWVTANRYLPAEDRSQMPGIILCPSHHNPKHESELQTMGITWARQGCTVLVVDNLGHGERRQHPFAKKEDFAGEFRIGRQDYFFRYHVGMQLHLAGETLAGWMVWDLLRGVDVLWQQPGIDRQRIALLGAVAGGGDPAAVAGALDERIACVAPFNFGGPQPETRYPLPDDIAETFLYSGGGSWESTRNLTGSVAGGFYPWVIVGATAPRRLIYAHEFSWDRARDPVWKRLETIFGYYQAADHLAYTHGHGELSGQPPQASHCNNIGAAHRERIHAAFQRWFDIPLPPRDATERHTAAELACVAGADAPPLVPARRLALDVAGERAKQSAAHPLALDGNPTAARAALRESWTALLGPVDPWPRSQARLTDETNDANQGPGRCERFVIEVEEGLPLPGCLLRPVAGPERSPIVLCLAQAGQEALLRERAVAFSHLLQAGIAVCVADVRGMGETAAGHDRGRRSEATSLSSTCLMLGQPLVAEQLRDVRTLLQHLRRHAACDGRLAIWGDSLAAWNAAADGAQAAIVPLDANVQPPIAEPGPELLALLAGLFEPELRCVIAPRGGLVSLAAVLEHPCCWIPHDVIVPGALTVGDLSRLAEHRGDQALWLSGLVDGLNRPVDAETLAAAWPAQTSPERPAENAPDGALPGATVINTLDVSETGPQKQLADWVTGQLLRQ